MYRRDWIIRLIFGLFIAVAIVVGLALATVMILPVILILIIALPLYYWMKKRRRQEAPGTAVKREETVNESSYTVLNGDEEDS